MILSALNINNLLKIKFSIRKRNFKQTPKLKHSIPYYLSQGKEYMQEEGSNKKLLKMTENQNSSSNTIMKKNAFRYLSK